MVLTTLGVLGVVLLGLPVLAGQSEVLVDEELAGDRVAGGEEGEPDDDTCETGSLVSISSPPRIFLRFRSVSETDKWWLGWLGM